MEGDIHVLPKAPDWNGHRLSSDCWCSPELKSPTVGGATHPAVYLHNDGADEWEYAEEL